MENASVTSESNQATPRRQPTNQHGLCTAAQRADTGKLSLEKSKQEQRQHRHTN